MIKIKFKYLIQPAVISLILLPTFTGFAFADTSSSSSGSPLSIPVDLEESTTLAQRIAQRKNALQIQLTTAQTQNIIKKCQAAQTKLQVIKAKDQTSLTNRTKIYSDLAAKLNTVIKAGYFCQFI